MLTRVLPCGRIRVAAFAISALLVAGRSVTAATGEGLANSTLQGGKVLSARAEPGGRFVPPAPPTGAAQPIDTLPAFCRVTASLRPTSDSDIRIEVWLPTMNWNGKLQSVGNSAWGGVISYG